MASQSNAQRFDAIVIGTGQAATPLAKQLTERGWQVALLEGGRVGGSCVNVGCTPSKTIIASARIAHHARRAADYGVHVGEITIDFARVMERAHQISGTSRANIEKSIRENERITLIREYAQFEASDGKMHRVRAGDQRLESERVYLNVGARAAIPQIDGLDTIEWLDNTSILELQTLPRHLIFLGGGYISVEYGQAFRRFGCEVTIIDNQDIVAREDDDIREAMRELLETEGIRLHTGTQVTRVEPNGDEVRLHLDTDGKTSTVSGSHLMINVGRTPNSDRLALDAAGVEMDDKGFITVDDHLLTNIPGIWALGDVNGRGAFTHTAYNDYEIALDNLNGGKRKVSDRITVYGVFTDPPLARVGMSEKEARESGKAVLMAVHPMASIGRAKEYDETQGLIKLLVDAKTERFLGAAVFGMGGDEVIHSVINIMNADQPYTTIQNAVPVHPTVSEFLPTILGELKPLDDQPAK